MLFFNYCSQELRVYRLGLILVLCAVSFFLMTMSVQGAEGTGQSETVRIQRVEIQGLIHTKESTLLELLRRPIPGEFTLAEVHEFERRIRNLSLFDHVDVSVKDGLLTVEVREKITLAPILNFTSGSSLQDLNATVGLVEYNIGGTGAQLGGQFNYSQRGPNAEIWIAQHALHPTRWAKEADLSYNANGIRFSDSTTKWDRRRFGSEVELKGPYSYNSPLRYEVVFKAYRELIEEAPGSHPSNGYFIGIAPELTWDRYRWHDLVPSGYRIAVELRPGYFLGPNQNRHEGRIRYLQGIPLADTTVLMINAMAEAVNAGNPNHSLLIGSIAGVRGLSDNLFRNRAQAYTNLEVRHAISLAPRWALQGVLFSDLGTFQPFTEEGRLRGWKGAASIGAGFRIVPTFLANTLLRVDFAQLLAPSPNSLVQFGITQYF
ncbi:MAG: hypothetical protein ACT4OO_01760 [Nitrospiraceae bacterium]